MSGSLQREPRPKADGKRTVEPFCIPFETGFRHANRFIDTLKEGRRKRAALLYGFSAKCFFANSISCTSSTVPR